MQSFFADAVANISMVGGLVRITFGVGHPTKTEAGEVGLAMDPNHQVVLPLDAFVKGFGIQDQFLKNLIAEGVVKIEPPKEEQHRS